MKTMTPDQMITKLRKDMKKDLHKDWLDWVSQNEVFKLKTISIDSISHADGLVPDQDNIDKMSKSNLSNAPVIVVHKDGTIIDGNHRHSALKKQGAKKIQAYVGEGKMNLPKEIEQFVNNLVPTDVGVDNVGDYIVRYEGFTDECNDGHDDNSIDDVYADAYQDFDNRQNQTPLIRGVANDSLGCDNNPVLYSVYKNINENYKSQDVTKQGRNLSAKVKKHLKGKNTKLTKVKVSDLDMDTPGFDRIIGDLGDVNFADTTDPIVVDADGKTILDGFHRVQKAKDIGKEVIPAYKVVERKLNLKLIDQEISEARLYRTSRNFNALTGEDVAKLFYLTSISTFMMLNDDKQYDYAKEYIKQTVQYGPYTLFRSHATDLYLLGHVLKNPDTRSITLKNPISSKRYLRKLNFDSRKHYMFFMRLKTSKIKGTEFNSYFLRLESQLKINDQKYKQWRRLIADWENLKYSSRQLVVSRLLQEYRRLGRGSEMVSPLTTMAKYRSYKSSEYQEPKTSFAKRAAGTVAGAAAGRYVGKKIAKKLGKNVDKYKRAGTGIGAIAGYWASGRKKQ